MFRKISFPVLLPVLFLVSCSGGNNECDPFAQEGCEEGEVCEFLTNGDTACVMPLKVRGLVFDISDDAAIEDARVVARDANGSVASTVAVTDNLGEYELNVAATRDEDGQPTGSITLRADAAAYQTFPGGVRPALPVDVSSPVEMDGMLIVDTVLTDIGLIPLEPGAGTATIHGSVEIPDESRGALVVAESDPDTGFTALADRNGDYRIFNLPAGTYDVQAYNQGVNYDAENVSLAGGEDKEVNIALNNDDPGDVSGTVQIVNAPGGSLTSIILAVESTFNPDLERGEVPPGLRAPPPPDGPSISGDYTFEGVPAGNYVVLAAFENDELVRDPDLSIGGTSLLRISVNSGQTTDVDGFKVTEALDVISPGASGPEAVTDPPTFVWEDDSSEKSYILEVFDSFGNKVWETVVDSVSGSMTVSATYDVDGSGAGTADPLELDNFYQFRVTSKSAVDGGGSSLSKTEDLRGVFFLQ